jgi:hypothetical protein
MTCSRHFLNFHWEHHAWRRRVLATDRVSTPVTDMWGRPVAEENVRCRTEYVCDVCGKTGGAAECLCDLAKGERCAIRRELIDAPGQAPG